MKIRTLQYQKILAKIAKKYLIELDQPDGFYMHDFIVANPLADGQIDISLQHKKIQQIS